MPRDTFREFPELMNRRHDEFILKLHIFQTRGPNSYLARESQS